MVAARAETRVLPVLFRIPRIFFPAGTPQAAYFMRYGVPRARIRIAQMTVDVRSIMAQVDRYRAEAASASCSDKPTVFLTSAPGAVQGHPRATGGLCRFALGRREKPSDHRRRRQFARFNGIRCSYPPRYRIFRAAFG